MFDKFFLEKDKIEINYTLKGYPLKGPLNFVSDDFNMKMLIFKQEDSDIINPCMYKKDANSQN